MLFINPYSVENDDKKNNKCRVRTVLPAVESKRVQTDLNGEKKIDRMLRKVQ